jgi:hypothetical protein
MIKSLSHKQQLKAFINAAQYFAGLTSGQDIWKEAGKVIITFLGADVAAFGKCRDDGTIEINHWAFSERGASAQISEPEMIAAARDVFESGYLTFFTSPTNDPIATAFLPILHENRLVAVMLVGHLSSASLPKEILDLYLAVAGLIGAANSRKISEANIQQLNSELEQRVIARTAQLEITNKELESFTYAVSHDLMSPLRHIEGFIQILSNDYADKLDDKGRDLIQRVIAGAERMKNLINALLNLSRFTRLDVKRSKVYLSALGKTVAEELTKTQPERRVEFIIADDITGEGDPVMLRAVIDNLIGNAWKFTEKRPVARIEFGVTKIEGKDVYFVKDDGAGFNMKFSDRLYKPFQRLHSESEFPGFGIGLTIVQRIVQRHGGRVWAEGEVDKGATFYFTLQ